MSNANIQLNYYSKTRACSLHADTIEIPDILSLVIAMGASSTKHGRLTCNRITMSARIFIYLLNRADYRIVLHKATEY